MLMDSHLTEFRTFTWSRARRQLTSPVAKLAEQSPYPMLNVFVEFGVEKILVELENADLSTSIDNVAFMVPSLAQRLFDIWQSAIFSEFKKLDQAGGRILEAMSSLSGVGVDARISSQRLFKNPLDGVKTFNKYPEGIRRSMISIHHWIAECLELCSRLQSDACYISEFLDMDQNLHISGISSDKSDLHNGQRTVRVITAGAIQFVYKPRSVTCEAGYEMFSRGVNDLYGEMVLKAPRVLSRQGYGWQEFVPWSATPEKSLPDYYWRCGALLAVITAFRGTDYHNENVIASNGYPVAIDHECFLQPGAPGPSEAHFIPLLDVPKYTVLSTGLLPEWFPLNNGRRLLEISGIGSLRNQVRPGHIERPTNKPTEPHPTDDHSRYTESICEGFSAVYKCLKKNKRAMKALVQSCFSMADFRVVNRGTRIYYGLLRSALTPESLNGVGPKFNRLQLAYEEKPHSDCEAILAEEKRALEDGEIPIFNIEAKGHDLTSRGQAISKNFASRSPLENAFEQLDSLSEKDLKYQETLITNAYAAIGYLGNSKERTVSRDFEDKDWQYSEGGLLNEAKWIANQIHSRMMTDVNGHPSWLGFQLIPGTHAIRPNHLNHSLYDGLSGVLLFLAAYENVTRDSTHRETIERIIDKLEFALGPLVEKSPSVSLAAHLGGLAGLPSVIYSLHLVSSLCNLPRAKQLAKSLICVLKPDLIFQDVRLDFLGGTAGLLAVLGAVDSMGDLVSDELIDVCVEHLITTQCDNGGWETLPDFPPLIGFAHGTSGILLPLTRYAKSGRTVSMAIEKALQYETQMFDTTVRNWPDLRSRTKTTFKNNWCHGAPGTLLARHTLLPALKRHKIPADDFELPDVRHDLISCEVRDCDHLCCGNMGLASIMSACGLTTAARHMTQHILQRKLNSKYYCLGMDNAERVFGPGFFLGLTGIGYSLLRQVSPNIPCVLTLDGNDQ